MPVRDLLDLLSQARVLLSQIVVPHGRFLVAPLGLLRQQSPGAVSRSAGLKRARFGGWPGSGARLNYNLALLTLFPGVCLGRAVL
jgi:hypothetical protein